MQPTGSISRRARAAATTSAAALLLLIARPAHAQSSPAATAPAAATPPAPAAPRDRASAPVATTTPPELSFAARWRGSLMFASVSTNLNTLAPGLQLTQNPTVDATLALRPRFALTRQWQLRAGFNLLFEFTNSDTTTRQNEVRPSDTFVDLWFHGIPAWRWFRFWVAARLTLPTSIESRMRTMIVAPSLVTQASFTLDRVAGGALAVIANASYQRPIYQYTTGGVMGHYAYPRPCFGASSDACTQQLSGVANVSDAVSWSLVVAQDWGWISPGVLFAMTHAHAYEFDFASAYRALGLPPPTEAYPSWRHTSTFALWVDLTPTSYLTFELGYSMTRNAQEPNGTAGNPFFAQYQDMRLYLQTVFTPDRLYEQLTRRGASGRGVIRTRNDHAPAGLARPVLF